MNEGEKEGREGRGRKRGREVRNEGKEEEKNKI